MPAQGACERARLRAVTPVLTRSREAAPRNHREASSGRSELLEPLVDAPSCFGWCGEINDICKRLRQIETRKTFGAHQQTREIARFRVERIWRATFGFGIIRPEQRGRVEALDQLGHRARHLDRHRTAVTVAHTQAEMSLAERRTVAQRSHPTL